MPDAFQIETPPTGENPGLTRYLRAQFQRVSDAILRNAGEGGGVPEAPIDGEQYGRQDADWTVVTGGGGSAEWGDITGNINLQIDLQATFVHVNGDTMTGPLNIVMAGPNIQLKGAGPGPYVDFALDAGTDFEFRLQELSATEFRIQTFNASAKLWAYNFKWFDIGLSTSNVERGVRLLNDEGSVLLLNNTGALRLAQGAPGGLFDKSWITAEVDAEVNIFFDGDAKLSTTLDGIILHSDVGNWEGQVQVLDFFGTPITVLGTPHDDGQVWLVSRTAAGVDNFYICDGTGQFQIPALAPVAPNNATRKDYVDAQTQLLKDEIVLLKQRLVLGGL